MRFVSSTHATLATGVLTLPLVGLPPIEHICLFWTYTEAPSLRRNYPASSVLRASPPPHTARPVSHELPVDRHTAITAGASRVASGPLCLHAVAITPAGPMELFARTVPSTSAFPDSRRVGSCVYFFEACSAFTHVTACMLAKSPKRPFTPEAPTALFPPPPLRLLPGGANQFPGGTFTRCGPAPFHGARAMAIFRQ